MRFYLHEKQHEVGHEGFALEKKTEVPPKKEHGVVKTWCLWSDLMVILDS